LSLKLAGIEKVECLAEARRRDNHLIYAIESCLEGRSFGRCNILDRAIRSGHIHIDHTWDAVVGGLLEELQPGDLAALA
jgi:hypothetical protein